MQEPILLIYSLVDFKDLCGFIVDFTLSIKYSIRENINSKISSKFNDSEIISTIRREELLFIII